MNLRKNKIKGISFHHNSARKNKNYKSSIHDFFNLDELYLLLKKDTPAAFTNLDIRRFLLDHGRNEINSRISLCLEYTTKWKGILNVIEKCFPNHSLIYSNELNLYHYDDMGELNEIELYLHIKKLIGLLKHNLSILEMAAQAQNFIGKRI